MLLYSWRGQILLSLAGGLLLSAPVSAAVKRFSPRWVRPVVARQPTSALNCVIIIDTVTQTGQRGRIEFRTKLRSENECRVLAGFHRPNFEPARVSSKQVAFRWLAANGGVGSRSRRR